MNDDLEKLLSKKPDDFERVLYRAEDRLLLLENMLHHSAKVSATLDKSYDLLLAGLAECQDDEDDSHQITAKARSLVKQFRGFRDNDTSDLLARVFAELHALHAIHKGRTP